MKAITERRGTGPLERPRNWAERHRLQPKLAVGLILAAAPLGILTYGALTGWGGLAAYRVPIVTLDILVLLLLSSLIAYRIVRLWIAHRQRMAGSRLHVRLVILFGLLAVTPAIVVAVFSGLIFHFGVQAWFSDQVKTSLAESFAVAEAYLEEHKNNIRADLAAMTKDLRDDGPLLLTNPERLNRIMETQTALRNLSEAVIFDENGRILARGGFTLGLQIEPLPIWALNRAKEGEIAVLTSDNSDRLRALAQLSPTQDIFLFVGRAVDPKVLAHIDRTRVTVQKYFSLEEKRSYLQFVGIGTFTSVTLLLLLSAIWVGLTLATELVRPIGRLIDASEEVAKGNLSVRVPEGSDDHELSTLSRTFNRMTGQLESQQAELVEANRQLDLRRRFTEAVLSGVSAGVVGLDASGRINLPNRTASRLLFTNMPRWIGHPLHETVPEMKSFLDDALRHPGGLTQSQVELVRGGRIHTLLVRISAERDGDQVLGFVVTFDDITELVSAQRKAAWAGVARRIAHEIKNPLTPIQLAAERLKRKYMDEIKTDPEIFSLCTEAIVRQVSDLRRMVDEFSEFARLPAPRMKMEDLSEICRQAIFLQASGRSDIVFETSGLEDAVWLNCDREQMSRVLTNLLQNAVDAIDGREKGKSKTLERGRITLDFRAKGDSSGLPVLIVGDNGRGLPPDLSTEKLTEPYVTTRERGTGLGLAIVKKILEDHQADLLLENAPAEAGSGARVRIIFRALAAAGTGIEPGDGEIKEVAHGA